MIKHIWHMFKDNFKTVARAHHLSLSTERSYWNCARRHIKWLGAKSAKDLEKDPTGQFQRHLTELANVNGARMEGDEGVSASTQNLFFHSLRFLYEKVVGVQLGDLSGIPRATGHERIVQVPDDDTAKRLVESVTGKSGDVLRKMYAECRTLPSVLREPEFEGLWDVTVQRNFSRVLKQLRFKKHYTCASIRYAAARRIAKEHGFLSAHEALGCKSFNSTIRILGKKLINELTHSVHRGKHSVAKIPTPI